MWSGVGKMGVVFMLCIMLLVIVMIFVMCFVGLCVRVWEMLFISFVFVLFLLLFRVIWCIFVL